MQLRPTWLVYSKTLTWLPFMLSLSLSCQRTFSELAQFVVNVHGLYQAAALHLSTANGVILTLPSGHGIGYMLYKWLVGVT